MKQFKCTNNKYIPASYMCDGIDGCGDNSDEIKGCTGTICKVKRIMIKLN